MWLRRCQYLGGLWGLVFGNVQFSVDVVPLLFYCVLGFSYFCMLSSNLSWGFIGNNLSTSLEVVVWTAYTLPSPDPTMWEYTEYVVVVVKISCLDS